MDMQAHPEVRINGLTFWPVPEFSAAVAAFGAHESAFFNRRDLPKVPSKYLDAAASLFYSGGKPDLGDDVPKGPAIAALSAWLGSFVPAHETKMATAGYALWVWAPESASVRAKVPA
jgi:hypothetical protein